MAKHDFQGNRDFQLDSLALMTNTGHLVDLSTMYRELNVFEDIFSNSVSGSALITDATNLVAHLPIIGQEKIYIAFRTPGYDQPVAYALNVYKVGTRARIKEKVQAYMIYFTSPETITNAQTKISRPYNDTGTQIAKKIFKDAFEFEPAEVEESRFRHNVVIPRLRPFKAINWILGRTVKKDNDAVNFLCYQNADGYNIRSIDTLYEQSPVQEYIHEHTGLRPRENKKDRFRNIEEFEIVNQPNTFDWLNKGVWASRMIGFDIENKSITHKDYDYDRDFSKVNHLGGNKLKNNSTDVDGNIYSEAYDSLIRPYPATLDNHAKNWLLTRKSHMLQADALKINITVSGDSELRVGDIVTVNVPSNEPEFPNPEGKALDKYLTGDYLITGLRHKINGGEYRCILEVSRDSFANAVPDSKEMKS